MDITEVKISPSGEITDVMINGNTYGMEKAVKMVKDGRIEGVVLSQRENGEEYISHFTNGMELTDLPRFV